MGFSRLRAHTRVIQPREQGAGIWEILAVLVEIAFSAVDIPSRKKAHFVAFNPARRAVGEYLIASGGEGRGTVSMGG